MIIFIKFIWVRFDGSMTLKDCYIDINLMRYGYG